MEDGLNILENRFKIIKKLWRGGFSEIYLVKKMKTGELLIAKVEKAVENSRGVMLFWESKLIHKLYNKIAVPKVHFTGN